MIRYHTTWIGMCQIVMGLSLLMMACKPEKEVIHDLSGYFYPLDEFPAEGVTYSYYSMLDSTTPPEIWHFKKLAPGKMESISYNEQGQVVLRQVDQFVHNGILTDSLVLYAFDSLGVQQQIPIKVISPNRFPFDAIDSSKVWLTHLDWHQPGDSLHIVLHRNRKFAGSTIWKEQGKDIPAVRFTTEDMLETERDGWTTSTWKGEEIYALNIGLVYYKRTIADQMNLEFGLKSRK